MNILYGLPSLRLLPRLPWRHHDGRVAVGPLAAHGALDAAPVVVEVRGQHLAVIVKCLEITRITTLCYY